MSENNFTHAHGLVGMFIEMTAADGQMESRTTTCWRSY